MWIERQSNKMFQGVRNSNNLTKIFFFSKLDVIDFFRYLRWPHSLHESISRSSSFDHVNRFYYIVLLPNTIEIYHLVRAFCGKLIS